MNILSNIDYFLIFFYFVVLVATGYFLSRRQKEEDYLIANRSLGSFLTMMTINASKTGSILMIFTGMVYMWGISAVWYFGGLLVGILFFIPFSQKLKDISFGKYYTLADYFKHNFGAKSALVASLLTIFLMFGQLVTNLIGGAKLFSFFSGWPFWICVIIMSSIVLSYILMSGFKAVVGTDVIQYFALFSLIIFLSYFLFDSSLIPKSDLNFFQADFVSVLGFFVVGALFPFGAPDLWQRVYSAGSKRKLKNGLILGTIAYGIVGICLTLTALTVKAHFPEIDPEQAVLFGFSRLLPIGFLGLSVVLLFSAIMSSLDTYIFTASSAISQDFFKRPKKETVGLIKKTAFLLTVLGAISAILIKNFTTSVYMFISSVIILATVVVATRIKKGLKEKTLLFGFGSGVLGAVVFTLLGRGIDPTIIVVSLVSTVVGLIIGNFFPK